MCDAGRHASGGREKSTHAPFRGGTVCQSGQKEAVRKGD